MRAELQGKSDPALDHLEDTLTDAVFSALGYLPRRQALRGLLQRLLPDRRWSDADLDRARIDFWPQLPAVLWPGRIIEPDVVVVVGRTVAFFEAKYHSDFGIHDLDGANLHQVAVQWRAGVS